MIPFLMFLAKAVGRMAVILSLTQSALGRTQTRLLTAARFRGWMPENEAAANRLAHCQFKLFMWRAAREIARKKKRGEPILETVPKDETEGT